MDVGQIKFEVYEALATDRYGGWLDVFGESMLKAIVDRIVDEVHDLADLDDADDDEEESETTVVDMSRLRP